MINDNQTCQKGSSLYIHTQPWPRRDWGTEKREGGFHRRWDGGHDKEQKKIKDTKQYLLCICLIPDREPVPVRWQQLSRKWWRLQNGTTPSKDDVFPCCSLLNHEATSFMNVCKLTLSLVVPTPSAGERTGPSSHWNSCWSGWSLPIHNSHFQGVGQILKSAWTRSYTSDT